MLGYFSITRIKKSLFPEFIHDSLRTLQWGVPETENNMEIVSMNWGTMLNDEVRMFFKVSTSWDKTYFKVIKEELSSLIDKLKKLQQEDEFHKPEIYPAIAIINSLVETHAEFDSEYLYFISWKN